MSNKYLFGDPLTWETDNDRIVFSNLREITKVMSKFKDIESDLIDFDTSDTIESHFIAAVEGKTIKPEYSVFLEEY